MPSTPRPVTPASPKVAKIKTAQPGVPMFGCEHIQLFLSGPGDRLQSTITHYKNCIRVAADTPIVPQTSKNSKGQPLTTLTPNYLCLQCNSIVTSQGRVDHGKTTSHRFYVDSKNGSLFCQMCNDYVYDPTLEELRIRKYGTGSLSARKRKHDEFFADSLKDDPRFISSNMVETPCRATGVRGIYNMGATCYMNVILQPLAHNPMIRNWYLSDGHQASECQKKNCVGCSMDDMFQEFYASDLTTGYSASNILACVLLSPRKAYVELSSNKEQDAHEFFQFITEELHEIYQNSSSSDESSPKRPKTGNDGSCKCIIHQTFYGKMQSTITCQSCKSVNTSADLFLDISLGLDVISKKKNAKALSLKQCLDTEYKQGESCDYACRECDSQRATKQLSIKSLPNVLCIQLKRFKQNIGSASKIETKVTFPLKLDMFPYTARAGGESKHSPDMSRGCTYDLQSVVVHVGNLETGHYICYSRVGQQWFKFNDHKVMTATKSQVLAEEAFLLFYVIQSLA